MLLSLIQFTFTNDKRQLTFDNYAWAVIHQLQENRNMKSTDQMLKPVHKN